MWNIFPSSKSIDEPRWMRWETAAGSWIVIESSIQAHQPCIAATATATAVLVSFWWIGSTSGRKDSPGPHLNMDVGHVLIIMGKECQNGISLVQYALLLFLWLHVIMVDENTVLVNIHYNLSWLLPFNSFRCDRCGWPCRWHVLLPPWWATWSAMVHGRCPGSPSRDASCGRESCRVR